MILGFYSTMEGFAWGGSEELWAAAARAALAGGDRVVVSVPRWRPRAAEIQGLIDAGAVVSERYRLHSKKLRRLADRVLLRHSVFARLLPRVVCISQGATYDVLIGKHQKTLGRLTAGFRIPYVVLCQYNDEMLLSGARLRVEARVFFDRAARVVFVADHNRRLAERQLACHLSKATVIQNPAKLTSTAQIPWRTQNGPVRLCSVARLETRHKGQDILFEALGSAPWRQRAWELRLYGSGPDRQYLENLAQLFGIADRVRFMGQVADVRAVWTENDLLVLPSYGEGTPLALMEAMLCGRPAVVTDVGGNTEWIEEGKSGFVAAAPVVSCVAAALERAWASRDRWQEMGRQAHATALARRDPNPGRTLLSLLQAAARPI